jgi:hypothetical protein
VGARAVSWAVPFWEFPAGVPLLSTMVANLGCRALWVGHSLTAVIRSWWVFLFLSFSLFFSEVLVIVYRHG